MASSAPSISPGRAEGDACWSARAVVGGAAVTEEFHPGFRNSVASYTVSLLNPKVIADMGLAERGLRIVERPISNFLPQARWRLSEARRRPGAHPGRVPQVLRPATPRPCRTITPRSRASPTCCATLALKTPPNAGGGFRRSLPPRPGLADAGGAAGAPARHARPVRQERPHLPRHLVRERGGQSRRSASMRWSATTPAPIRRARPMCCSTTSSAR